jgi:hypothetical protein
MLFGFDLPFLTEDLFVLFLFLHSCSLARQDAVCTIAARTPASLAVWCCLDVSKKM